MRKISLNFHIKNVTGLYAFSQVVNIFLNILVTSTTVIL